MRVKKRISRSAVTQFGLSKEAIIERLRKVGSEIIGSLSKGEFPEITMPLRATSNIVYDEMLRQYRLGDKEITRTTKNIKHLRPFAQLVWMAAFTKHLVKNKKTSTLRDAFYNALGFGIDFENQQESDDIIMDLETIVGTPREDFHVFPEERSSIFGPLVIEYDWPGYEGKRMDLTTIPDGAMIGPALTTSKFVRNRAEMVIVVEKGAVYQRFLEENVSDKFKALIIHTAGQPPRATRRFIRRLNQELGLPVYIFADADVYGMHIASVIIYGSAVSGHITGLATPDAVWAGVWASVTPDESVLVERNGLLRNEEIREVVDNMLGNSFNDLSFDVQEGLKALTCSPECHLGFGKVTAVSRHRYDGHIYEIRTRGGYRVKATGNHSVMVFDYSEFRIVPKRVDQLKVGDLIPVCFSVPNNESLTEINLADMIKQEAPYLADTIFVEGPDKDKLISVINQKYTKQEISKKYCEIMRKKAKLSYFFKENILPENGYLRWSHSNIKIPVKIKITAEFCRLLGYHASEGWVEKHSCGLRFRYDERGYVEDAVNCIKSALSCPELTISYSKGEIRYGGTLLRHIYEKVLKTGSKADDKRVPYIIFNVPTDMKKEFLRACFRRDRMTNHNLNKRLRYKTSSRKLASDIVVLLRQIGCVAYTYHQDGSYVIHIDDVKSVIDIPAELCRKPVTASSRLRSLPGRLLYELIKEIKDEAPGKKTEAYDVFWTNQSKVRVPYDRLKRLMRLMGTFTNNPKIDLIKTLVSNDIVLLPVTCVKDLGKTSEPVYDLEVDGSHTFIGGLGGFVLHNSDIVKYKLPSMKLEDVDIKRLSELEKDPRYQVDPWKSQIKVFWKIKRKCELEAFARYGLPFIVEEFLPERLAELQKR